MKWWTFHEEMLARALAAREAERQGQGATEQQAKDDTQTVVAFLASESAQYLLGGQD